MKTVYWVIVIVLVGAATFYGGMRYSQLSLANRTQTFQNLRTLSPDERQQRLQQLGMINGQTPGGIGGAFGGSGRMGGISGDVISKDDKSFTVKLRDGGTRIVFFSPTTQTIKSVDAAASDIQVGSNVIVSGPSNPDGSVTAQNVQIRPTIAASPTTISTVTQ